jgi:hypothetical protein
MEIDMKVYIQRILVAACTFGVGLVVGVWFSNPELSPINIEMGLPTQAAVSDMNVYPVKLRDLLTNPRAYDQKFVKIQATFHSDDDLPAIFSDPSCEGLVRYKCAASDDVCEKIYQQIAHGPVPHGYDGYDEMQVEVIGRFKADGGSSMFFANDRHEPFLETLELKVKKYRYIKLFE